MKYFDRHTPGDYLRLIKRVRVSVIALIPPTQGFNGALSLLGPSRVGTADTHGSNFTETIISRPPERLAISSPLNTGGAFEPDEQPEMLRCFEGSGVVANWLFEMPRAANFFDYSTIADVLVTIDYTALHSDIYKSRVTEEMRPQLSAERVLVYADNFRMNGITCTIHVWRLEKSISIFGGPTFRQTLITI